MQSDAREIPSDPPQTHPRTNARAAANPVSAVGSLTQMIREECAVVDRTRAIPATVVDALRDAGVFHLLAPRAVGGAETDPLTFLRVVEEVSYADGSAG
jgi:indole-3-acetate monooxygenase